MIENIESFHAKLRPYTLGDGKGLGGRHVKGNLAWAYDRSVGGVAKEAVRGFAEDARRVRKVVVLSQSYLSVSRSADLLQLIWPGGETGVSVGIAWGEGVSAFQDRQTGKTPPGEQLTGQKIT